MSTSEPASPKPIPKPKPKVVEDVGLAPLDDFVAPPEPQPIPQPKLKPVSQPPAPVHKPKNPHIPPSESFLAPMSSLPPLEPIDGTGMAELSGGKVDLFGGSDPLAVANTGGYSVAPDPFAPASGALGGYGLPAGDPFAPSSSLAGGLPPASPGVPGRPVKKPIQPIMVILPAIFQIMVHVPLMLFTMFSFSMLIATFATVMNSELAPLATKSMPVFLFYCFMHVVAFAFYVWGIFGSINMIQFRNHDNAIAAAWVSAIPCINPCAMPFGIWSLIVLQDRGVKRMFAD